MYLILLLLLITLFFISHIYVCGIDSKLKNKTNILIFTILVLAIGLRPEGIDNDYSNYLMSIDNNKSIGEPTFILLAFIISSFSLPHQLLFLTYAFCGILLKVYSINKLSLLPIVSYIIYLSHIILLHDINQIRAGVASGLFLLSIIYYFNDKRKYALIIFIASLFHFSALLFFILLPLSRKRLSKKSYVLWAMLPILGYIVHFVISSIDVSQIPIAPIREKMEMYKSLEEMDVEGFSEINLFNSYIVFKLVIYYIILNYYYFLEKIDNRITFYIKTFSISLFLFPALGAITPILGYRASELFGVVEILLFPYLFMLFKGNKVKILCIIIYFLLLFTVDIIHKHLIFFI